MPDDIHIPFDPHHGDDGPDDHHFDLHEEALHAGAEDLVEHALAESAHAEHTEHIAEAAAEGAAEATGEPAHTESDGLGEMLENLLQNADDDDPAEEDFWAGQDQDGDSPDLPSEVPTWQDPFPDDEDRPLPETADDLPWADAAMLEGRALSGDAPADTADAPMPLGPPNPDQGSPPSAEQAVRDWLAAQ